MFLTSTTSLCFTWIALCPSFISQPNRPEQSEHPALHQELQRHDGTLAKATNSATSRPPPETRCYRFKPVLAVSQKQKADSNLFYLDKAGYTLEGGKVREVEISALNKAPWISSSSLIYQTSVFFYGNEWWGGWVTKRRSGYLGTANGFESSPGEYSVAYIIDGFLSMRTGHDGRTGEPAYSAAVAIRQVRIPLVSIKEYHEVGFILSPILFSYGLHNLGTCCEVKTAEHRILQRQ
ncbi:hypothetical protein BKA70DRAFT_1498875 [Coprinopsis sp. MPI-PUGE-AT-0042]|nr:hypothetical protein BKA70DRAFT_1498875 [Coprinopsis sp. MPI-PUGE-AT-0042]